MMETEKNIPNNDLEKFRNAITDYQKGQVKNKKISSEELLAKYFTPRKSKEMFRILPYKEKFFEEVYFHVVPTLISGGKLKHNTILYCLAENEAKVPKLDENGIPVLDGNRNPMMISQVCPLCEKSKALKAKQDKSIPFGKKREDLEDYQKNIFDKNREYWTEGTKYESKKFYIIKGIDRGIEKDGVKFWRFKHNFKNQGTIDKLFPILEEYIMKNSVLFSDINEGTDLSITMADTMINNKPYKTISAISCWGKSPLHPDPVIAQQWLNDDIVWSDIFKSRKAPNITPFEYLEMVANLKNPYWDETNQNEKHWVFPGRPDLQEKANTRNVDLTADENQSLPEPYEDDGVRISNITPSDVGDFTDDSLDVGKLITKSDDTSENSDVYDDLPF